jgi:hypothetical protein
MHGRAAAPCRQRPYRTVGTKEKAVKTNTIVIRSAVSPNHNEIVAGIRGALTGNHNEIVVGIRSGLTHNHNETVVAASGR